MATETFTPKQLRAKLLDKKWIMPYNQLLAILDQVSKKVMYVENYGPEGGFFIEAWRAKHMLATSPIVEKSYREGGNTIFIIREGKARLKLTPSFAPIGIEECQVVSNSINITFAGLGGGGVSAAYSRGMADGVNKVKVLAAGGGTKLGKATLSLPINQLLLIAVDDTDNDHEGATYSLVHNIAVDAAKKYKVRYLIHNNVQLYPANPYKTRNCMGTVIGMAYKNKNDRIRIINYFKDELKKHTFSDQTAMAVFDGFALPEKLIRLGHDVKNSQIENTEKFKKIAIACGVGLYPITGERGLIGAVGSLAFFDQPELAADLPILA